ncbi:MAG TPA: methyltransferase domain-containing protein [Polyangia bacterium]|nr:methyltransferase domain-containing protein [Polyangia bacterium]
MPTVQQRQRTLERFRRHRAAWDRNPALRALYAEWYGRIGAALPPAELGPRIELGSGPGFARGFIPGLELTDVVAAPWHDRALSADAIGAADGSVGALVLFDVLHHLPAPRRFFVEAARVLRPGGRLVMCEPLISPLSYPVYKFLHEEPVDMAVDPLAMVTEAAETAAGAADRGDDDRDPFDSNQAIPTVLFGRRRRAFTRAFPSLRIVSVERLAGPSYPASGGFSRRALLPMPIWRALHGLERRLPSAAFRLFGFRILVVIERN